MAYWGAGRSLGQMRAAHPRLLAVMPNLLSAAAVIVEASFFVLVYAIGHGTPPISYPAPLKALEAVAILAIVVAVPLLIVRSVWMPVVALIGTAGGIPVAFHDEAVPGQRGHAEIVVLTTFAGVWVILSAVSLVVYSSRRVR